MLDGAPVPAHMEWGWILVDAFLGAAVAVVGLVVSFLMLTVERKRDAEAKKAQLSGRVVNVNAWTAEMVGVGEGSPEYGVVVQNSTEVPVFDMTILHTTAWGAAFPKPLVLDTVPPGAFFFASSFEKGPRWDFGRNAAELTGLHPVMRKREWRVFSMRFRDAHNVWWVRTPLGLEQADTEERAKQIEDIQVQQVAANAAVAVKPWTAKAKSASEVKS